MSRKTGGKGLQGLVVLSAMAMLLWGCSEEPQIIYQGYAEGEYLYVSSPLAGQLEILAVQRGTNVSAGDLLFRLERGLEAAAMAEAEQGLIEAENRWSDLTKGERPSELATIEARLAQAKAARDLDRREYQRRRQLFQEKFISAEELDQARSNQERSEAAVAELLAQLKTALLGGRSDAIEAARAEVVAARERLSQKRWRFEQKSQSAPEAGYLYDTLYVEGEFVPAAAPVVCLLPPHNIKIRFFVPEPVVGTLSAGQAVSVTFDGAQHPYLAQISYISSQAEYTPPIIYSRETRQKLVFMIEALPKAEEATAFHPGQPVDVTLEPSHD